jgi:L-alanine-DL-glutamate epimerase-like enolase superfamily enzyme
MRDARDLDVRWFEEPVSPDDLDGLRLVRQSLDCDVTAGEYGCALVYFRRMCAASYNLEVSAHCAPHLHVHAACATPNMRHLEWFHDHVRIEQDLFDGALRPVDGALRPRPDAPGHGPPLRE